MLRLERRNLLILILSSSAKSNRDKTLKKVVEELKEKTKKQEEVVEELNEKTKKQEEDKESSLEAAVAKAGVEFYKEWVDELRGTVKEQAGEIKEAWEEIMRLRNEKTLK